MQKAKQADKDSVFIDLFSQPYYAMEWAKALNHGMDIAEENAELVTLRTVLTEVDRLD